MCVEYCDVVQCGIQFKLHIAMLYVNLTEVSYNSELVL